jgi:hypothetical protein
MKGGFNREGVLQADLNTRAVFITRHYSMIPEDAARVYVYIADSSSTERIPSVP